MKILEVMTQKRRIGNLGEDAAVKFLKKSGYKIKERNYVSPCGEIDIIAENKEFVIFAEVKSRTLGKENSREPRPASAVTPEKQRKLISSAKYYIGQNRSGKHLRLDVIEVYISDEGKASKPQKIIHMENAFNINTAMSR